MVWDHHQIGFQIAFDMMSLSFIGITMANKGEDHVRLGIFEKNIRSRIKKRTFKVCQVAVLPNFQNRAKNHGFKTSKSYQAYRDMIFEFLIQLQYYM